MDEIAYTKPGRSHESLIFETKGREADRQHVINVLGKTSNLVIGGQDSGGAGASEQEVLFFAWYKEHHVLATFFPC